jgi:hypothetical protein
VSQAAFGAPPPSRPFAPSPTRPRTPYRSADTTVSPYRGRSRRRDRLPGRLPPLTPVGPGYQRRLPKTSTSSERKLSGRPATVSDPSWPPPRTKQGPRPSRSTRPSHPTLPGNGPPARERTGWVPNGERLAASKGGRRPRGVRGGPVTDQSRTWSGRTPGNERSATARRGDGPAVDVVLIRRERAEAKRRGHCDYCDHMML